MTKIGDELVALRRGDGLIHASDVVDWARENPRSATGETFEWDRDKAAYQHWLDHARRLISVHVVTLAGERQTISLVIDRNHGGGYRRMDDVLNNADLRRAAVEDAVKELLRWKERHGYLRQELQPVFSSVDRLARNLLPPGAEAAD
jgi:hypothetical protein